MRGLFSFLSGLYLFYLFFLFIGWYIKGHFGKYFLFFWVSTILSIFIYKYGQYKIFKEDFDSRSAQEIWDERMKNYDAVRGY